MDYYKLRSLVAKEVMEWLETRAKNPTEAKSVKAFHIYMNMKHGATKKMIKENLQDYNLKIENNELVQIE